jgi:hypothetical protein
VGMGDVFVVGLDEPNLRSLRRVPGADGYQFHPLLSVPKSSTARSRSRNCSTRPS